ncbi:NADH-quinone oxidoreductase subunit K [Ornithinimicrobium sufpigmenti]|uniref:NADH-quinone oxidoreductase subunit K n=1 Tax=Ornithinimicrobium sufpigmenti TaxID=2508882 RepID=UPI0010360E9D|nr:MULTISPECIES: NADH-quinone oxidoreductase subunit K [unclassified Ornithinimicrobium]
MSAVGWFLLVGAALFALGTVRLLTAPDLVVRLVALNIAGSGALLALVALAARTTDPDAVPHALALTGIVITVAVTGVGLAVARRLESDPERGQDES